MIQLYIRYLMGALVWSSAVAVVVGVIGLLGWYTSPVHTFSAAQQAWAANPIPRYRLIIERPSLHCQQDVIVENERIVEIIEDTCPIELLTMTDLYNRIARLDGMESFDVFVPDSCGCNSRIDAHVLYDETLGYPNQIGISALRQVDWQQPNCWRYILMHGQLPECDLPLFFAEFRMTNVIMQPMP